MANLPTDRNGRFVFRQRKYKRLRRRQQNLFFTYSWDGEDWVYAGRSRGANTGPLMGPSGLVRRPAGPLEPPSVNPYDVYVTAEGRGKPPHVKLATFPWHPPLSAVLPYGWRAPLAGYHRKRILSTRRWPKAMNALQRRVWGANVFYHQNGVHSATDPLGRRPNENDPESQNGPFYAEGPWPTVSPRDV